MDRILVATDFSDRSNLAVRRAALIAQQTGAALSVVHVVDNDQSGSMIDAERDAAEAALEDTARAIAQAVRIAVDLQVKVDDVTAGISAAAEASGAGLIIIGTPRTRLRDVFVGTTAERMVRASRLPLLVAHQAASSPYARTLLALDFDDASKTAAMAAVSMGVFEHTSVVGMHAFELPAERMMQRALLTPTAIYRSVDDEGRDAV